MKSFIPWIGGKSLLAKRIVGMFPDKIDRYIEVFGGGGSVLFYKDSHAPFEVYNDADSQLVNLFRCVKFHREELQKEINSYINSRELFNDMQQWLDMSFFTDIQRAAMFFVTIKTSFGANRYSYGCSPNNLHIDYLEQVEHRLKDGRGVVIEHKDFEDLIKVYDRPNALIYCDPPYHKTEKYYNEKFTEQDHHRLKNCLDKIKGKFILSYNDDEFIRELYKDYSITSVSRQNNLSTGQFKELIIKNY